MILMAIGPPVLAPILWLLLTIPSARVHLGFIAIYLVFWLSCGVLWLLFTRAVEHVLGHRQD
jgi:hypothetical protein